MKSRLKTSSEAESILTTLKERTTITPNILCRYGIVMSLKSNEPLDFGYNSFGLEFQRPVLTGEYDLLFRELIKQKENKNISDDEYFAKYLKAHLERGVRILEAEIALNGSFEEFIDKYFDSKQGGTI